jgi:hypothetical protein
MARSTAVRNWILGGAAGGVAIVALTWFFVVGPELGNANGLKQQTADAQTQNTVLQAKTNKLKEDNANLNSLTTALAQARAALPTNSGLPELTRQLSVEAAAAGVQLVSITAADPIVASGSASGAKTGTSGAAAGNIFAIPLVVVTDGSATHQQLFLTAVQKVGPRRVLVKSVAFAPSGLATTSAIDASSTMTVDLQAFVAPQSDADVATLQKLVAAARSQ